MKNLSLFVLFLCVLSVKSQTIAEKYKLPQYNCTNIGSQNLEKSKLTIVIPDSSVEVLSIAEAVKEFRLNGSALASIKRESEVTSEDLEHSMWILGVTNDFESLNKFSVPVDKVDNGFRMGNQIFTDSLHSFSYVTDSLELPLRIVTVGNSLPSFKKSINMISPGFKFIVLRNDVPEYIGQRFPLTSLTEVREDHYVLKETKYYKFLVSKNLEEKQIEINQKEIERYDKHAEAFVKKMELEMPKDKIVAFIHHNQIEIKYISGFFDPLCDGGTVAGLALDNEIHNWGFGGVVEHESNHVLFNSINKMPIVFLSEGIQKWYEYSNNDVLKQQGINKAKEFIDEDLADVIRGKANFFEGDKYYLISGVFTDYLLEKYGLSKFKELYTYEMSGIDRAFEETFQQSLPQILGDYKLWLSNF